MKPPIAGDETDDRSAVLPVVIAGGGTGGHLFPGIAVAREILARRPGARITFAGTARGVESRLIPREGFELDLLRSAGLKGKTPLDRLRGMLLVPLGLADAWSILSKRRPAVVIAVGGYSSGPVVLAAALRGIPTVLLEQNAVPGLTNRLLAPFVRAAAVTFETTRSFFGEKAFVSGNPVRSEFFGIEPPAGDPGSTGGGGGLGVLVFGGSQGAHAINVAMVEAAPQLAAAGRFFRITHQTGERDLEMVRAGYRRVGLAATVEPFLYDMGRQIAQADLIVCRAGSTTLAELVAAGRPAILIPLPTATDDHQRKNAEALASAGAADLLPQANAAALGTRILDLAADDRRRRAMGSAARALARPDAARVIVDRVLSLASR